MSLRCESNTLTDRPSLPNWHEITAACLGHLDAQRDPMHPVTHYAVVLAQLHRARQRCEPRGRDIFDSALAEITQVITRWVDWHIPPRGGSLSRPPAGRAVERLIAAQVQAIACLYSAPDASDPAVHEAWTHLAMSADRYDDVVHEIVDGQRPLPSASTGVRS